MQDGEITDDTRIKSALTTIMYLIQKEAKVILASHLGRPGGEVVEELRLDAVAQSLSNYLQQPVYKLDDVFSDEVNEAVEKMENRDVLLLENVRFEPGEKQNDPELAKQFASSLIFMSMMRLGRLTVHTLPQKASHIICRLYPDFYWKKRLTY